MRIAGVESTDLFTGSAGRPLQVVRVTLEATKTDETGVTARVRVMGTGAGTTEPFGIMLGEPGEGRTGEVSVALTGTPGVSIPVTVIAETDGGRAELAASVAVVEPGWTMWMVSHFHYDPVWWNTQGQFTEARLVLPDEDGELPDTRTAFDLVRLHLEKARRDPDYKFVLAELDYLKPHFDAFPGERSYLRSLLRDGRVELVGGTYNEPNTNLTGAETTIRNAVYGMGFQHGVLGAEVGSAWMLDAFGFDPGFPGLMAQAGLTSSSWARGPFHQWGPEVNTRMQFPAEFEWLSPDGSGLLTAYMTNHYGAGWELHKAGDLEVALSSAYQQFRSLAPVAATPNVMLPVGSDHVIPARWVTDVQRAWSERYVWPRFVSALPRDFFAAVRSCVSEAPKRYWIMPQTRDMNPLYTGKDVSYADTKLAARAGEVAVLEAERLATLAWLRGAPYPAESLDKAWRQLVYGAHHDAITGTEADQVYLDLLAGWREAWQRGDAARREAVEFLTRSGPSGCSGRSGRSGPSGPGATAEDAFAVSAALSGAGVPGGTGLLVTVANGLARPRDGMATVTVRLDRAGTGGLEVLDPVSGAALPALAEGVRSHPDGSLAEVTLTFRAAAVPPLGFRRYPLRAVAAPGSGPGSGPGSAPATASATAGWTDVEGAGIENEAFAVTGNAQRGGTVSITDKRSDQSVLFSYGNDLVLQEEYEQHPRWGEGPWHLTPKGPGVAARSVAATVVAQCSPAGSRLVATYSLGDLAVTAETLLWDGADRVEFRTHISGSIGKDHLLRVRFPAAVPGGLPVYQTATGVIGRPFGVPEADVAKHWWTLDNPANHWFGVGSVAKAVLSTPGGEVPVALGVAEVVSPDTLPEGGDRSIRDLVVSLSRTGVTATCSRGAGPRYGSVDIDSNLPDFRISLGGPSENAFTAEVLAACDPAVAKRLAALVADGGAARLWVPATQTRKTAFGPGADLRGPRDLPVLIVATADPGALGVAITELCGDVRHAAIPADVADTVPGPQWRGAAVPEGEAALRPGAVALFNQGTLGGVVTPDGTLWMSLFRACSSWPSGVWIDGDRRTAPDGSSFAWQHWSHTFSYALATAGTAADWREAGFNAAAEEYNHELIAVVCDAVSAEASEGAGLWVDQAANVTLSALKPCGNPLAAGRPGAPAADRLVTVRLRETDGHAAVAHLRSALGVAAAWRTDLLEETEGAPLAVTGGTAYVPLQPFETATFRVRLGTDAPLAAASRSAVAPPEPVQPVYTRYWLHGKGPAPAGNVPVAVHFSPTRVTLGAPAAPAEAGGTGTASGAAGSAGADGAGAGSAGADSARADGADSAGADSAGADGVSVGLSVACGPEAAAGTVELVVPDGLAAAITDAGGSDVTGTALTYDLAPNGFASWSVAVSALPGTPGGRYFLTARIGDHLGQVLEDTALVTIGEPGGPDPDLGPEELFFRMQSDVMALAGEVDLELVTPAVTLAPGETGELTVRVASHLGSQLRGELQLISPFGTWASTAPWTQKVEVPPGGETTVTFGVTAPATAAPGWESWLLVKLMYFGRVRYSDSVRFTVS